MVGNSVVYGVCLQHTILLLLHSKTQCTMTWRLLRHGPHLRDELVELAWHAAEREEQVVHWITRDAVLLAHR